MSGGEETTAPGTWWMLLPGTREAAWRFGGRLIAETATELIAHHRPARVATYRDREPDLPFLDEVLASAGPRDLFVVTWGPHVAELAHRLAPRRTVYYAQSTGWRIAGLPTAVPILCLSRHIMAYWMEHAPHNPLYLLGPVLTTPEAPMDCRRDVDVLFLARKSTPYLRDRLVPALRELCRVETVTDFLPRSELFELFARSRVYLYSSAPTPGGWVEGFGLQPLEALVSGCTVFSNLHGGLADYLDPELASYKLETYSLAHDVERVTAAVAAPRPAPPATVARFRETYGEEAFHRRVAAILPALDAFFAHAERHPGDLVAPPPPRRPPTWRVAIHRLRRRLERGREARRPQP